MKLKYFKFILLFMAVLFTGNTIANDIGLPEDSGIQVEQVTDINTIESIDVVTSAEIQGIAPVERLYVYHQNPLAGLLPITTIGDKDHVLIRELLYRYQSQYKPPKHPIARAPVVLQGLHL